MYALTKTGIARGPVVIALGDYEARYSLDLSI